MTTKQDSDYVVLTEEPSLIRAQWVAGALETHGIPTIVDDDVLMDEFAMSQKALGLQRIRVHVPGDRLDEARTVFLNLSQPIPLVDEDEDADGEGAAPATSAWPPRWVRRFALVWLLAGLVTLVAIVVSYCSGTT